MKPLPSIIGVSEIVLSVADLPSMKSFYIETLGFKLHSELSMETPVVDRDGIPTITFLVISEIDSPLGRNGHPQMLVLIDHLRHVYAKARFIGHDVGRSTLNHIAFEIPPDEYDAHTRHLTAQGIELSHTVFPDLNAKAMFLKDPEGNVLELICYHATGVHDAHN
ncbi:MAG: VOC family protein [Pirellula sp.]